MDNDLILSILQKSTCLNNTKNTEISKDIRDKLTNTKNVLVDPFIVNTLISIIGDILTKCIDFTATTTEAQLETQLVDLLHTWCQISGIPHHEIYTNETLKIFIDELSEQFNEVNLNIDELTTFREYTNNSSIKIDTIDDIYEKRIHFKQKVQLRNKVLHEFSKQTFQSPLIQEKIGSEIQCDYLMAERHPLGKVEETNFKDMVLLIPALNNLYSCSDISMKCKIRALIDKIMNHLFIYVADVNDFTPYFHIFYEEQYVSSNPNKINLFELTFIENVPASYIERIILQETLEIMSQLELQSVDDADINYNIYQNFQVLKSEFNKTYRGKLKKLFVFCKKSKKLFRIVTEILNELLIKVHFNYQILLVIQNLIHEIKTVINVNRISTYRLLDLYPDRCRELVFHLDLHPDTLKMLNLDGQILEKLFEIYLECPRVCLMLLSHFPAWISCFSVFFNNLCQ